MRKGVIQSLIEKLNLNIIMNLYIIISLTAMEHSECEYYEIKTNIDVECKDCAYNIKSYQCCKSTGRPDYYIDCKCFVKTLVKKECKICYQIKESIIKLELELDDLLYSLSYDIKHYQDCSNKIDMLNTISMQLRDYNRILLEKA